jgi:hypothetical protein
MFLAPGVTSAFRCGEKLSPITYRRERRRLADDLGRKRGLVNGINSRVDQLPNPTIVASPYFDDKALAFYDFAKKHVSRPQPAMR